MPNRSKRSVVALLAMICTTGVADAAEELMLGKRLYEEGVNARGEPVRALTGMPPAPLVGAQAACGACHGSDARGGPAAPDIRWKALAAGGAAAPYSERSFARAVSEGIAPSKALLSIAMPRYSLSNPELAAVVAYLRSLP